MTSEERVEMNRICACIQQEKDPGTFSQLLQQLTEFLDHVEQRKLVASQPTK